jgi:hypothetical protein
MKVLTAFGGGDDATNTTAEGLLMARIPEAELDGSNARCPSNVSPKPGA